MLRRFAAIAATALVLTRASVAGAETFSLSIVDPLGCTEQQHLIQHVTARAKGAAFVEDGGRLNFLLRFEQSTNRIVAELQTKRPNHPESTRVVDGESCREVIAAVALIMALTLDPRTGSNDTQPEPVTDADAPPAPQSNSTTRPSEPAVDRHEPYWVEGDFAETAAKNFQKDSPKSSPWRVGIGAELSWTTLFTNQGGMWLVGLRGEASKARRLVTVFRAILGPKVVRTDGNGISAAFSFYGVGAELGTPIVGSPRLATDAMLTASMGMLHAASRDMVASSGDATSTWLGLGPGVRLRWFGETASLALETAVPINVFRPRFTILREDGAAEVFYRAPLVGIFFGLCGTWNVEPSVESHRMIKSEPGGD